jgi:P27 family predicted phage terminase small subunit
MPKRTAKTIEEPTQIAAEQTETRPVVIVDCPTELGPVARQEWDRIVPQLAAVDRLSGLDRGILAVYCMAYASWLDATVTIQTYGSIMKSPNGHPMQSPAVSIANQNADIMIRIAVQFGFTPASRLRLPGPSKEPHSWVDDVPTLEDLGAGLKPLDLG